VANPNRKAMSSTERRTTKGVISAEALANSGKADTESFPGSGIQGLLGREDEEQESVETTKFYVPIAKASAEERTVTGVVLQPEVVDAQGDIMDKSVIRAAAHRFLAGYNTRTKPGLMHKDFKPRFEIVESYLAPQELTINGKTVAEGSWIMTMKVLDDKVWDQIKKGKLTGFSIGGKARVQKLEAQAPA
jgi:hypothetical protein